MATLATTARPMPTTGLTGSIIRHPLVAYFVLAFTFAWLPVLPLTLSRNAGVGLLPYDLPGMLLNVLFVVASFIGPTLFVGASGGLLVAVALGCSPLRTITLPDLPETQAVAA